MFFKMIEETYSKYKLEFLDSSSTTFKRIFGPNPHNIIRGGNY